MLFGELDSASDMATDDRTCGQFRSNYPGRFDMSGCKEDRESATSTMALEPSVFANSARSFFFGLPPATSQVTRVQVNRSLCKASDWDAFAQLCNASFRCAYQAAWMWQFEHHLFFEILFLDINLVEGDTRTKIGQCAIGVGHQKKSFADAIQLLPDYRDLWREAMVAVLARSGPGIYTYGSDWTLDKCRGEDLAGIAGVCIKDLNAFDVQVIDFGQWPTWDAYYRAVSTNAKRNVQKVERSETNPQIQTSYRSRVLLNCIPLQRARYRLFRRKSVSASLPRLISRSGLRLLATYTYSRLVRLKMTDAIAAFYLDIQFGRNTFFLEAAPAGQIEGASAYLLRAMIEDSYVRSGGRGYFVMGPDDHRQSDPSGWEGLRRSREQWRATAFPTSVAVFHYSAV